ncbi:MBL fold metallo-hydrolase [Ideonella sp. 4Y11]|uniref:MBL fold metallo-hydrolase n=1 Tax=Ideonella aquatica TaxID=2824119 RepID=A0A940YMI3_9BURK|nr:MBL fold metallo-hydrolase [Ideonella aquatica]MBQ0960666.1 MBL fold metallo-hydrolase [Ideonella aquatica]
MSTPGRFQRRRLLQWAAWTSLSPLVGCATAPMAVPGVALSVAPGVYMLPGTGGEVDPANLGRIGNAGFIVGPAGVLVIDSGVSARHGQALLAEIRRTTALPVRALLLTHVRQEFVFGASTFQAAGVPVWMHPAAARLMAARCDNCLKTLKRVLGDEAMAGSRVVRPDRLLSDLAAAESDLAALTGRRVRLLVHGEDGHSSGPGDLAVLDEASGTLFAGGLMDARSIPDVQDARPEGWRAALDALQALPLARIVPGHGPLAAPALIAQTRRYLDQLDERIAALLARGTPLSDVAEAATLPEFADWDQADTIHRRNASIVFLRQERALLLR